MKAFYFLFLTLLVSCNSNSNDAIFDIARDGTTQEMEKIIAKNPSLLDKKNKSGYSPLILACYHGNKEVVETLLKKNANINQKSDLGTALMAASYKAENDIAKLLIQNGAKVNLTDKNGKTALHYACFQQNVALVKLLIANKAMSNLKDANGKTALDFALDNNNIKIIKLLKP